MLTQFDKALAAILPGILAWLNQKYGMKIITTPETLMAVVAFISSILVYFVPNKVANT